ncbi:MAG: peptidase M14, partial [Calditrichaeota bacterium]|nr:peptidase M14 [Calditrichota bacterium]
MKSRFLQLFIVLTVAVLVAFADEQPDWRTDYEKSGYLETPRYAATIDYCQRLAAASDWVQFASFGKSPQGRDLPLLIVDKNGNFDPAAVRKSGNLVLLIQNGIHSGEIDGKDASLMLIREMVITKKLAHLLDGVTAIFIPIFNVDGHENVSEYNRLNQNGPAEMGFRATAQNLNLNRDFLKAESPEMRAWLQLFNQWLPDFLVDNHVTDGSDHQYVLTYGVETNDNVAEPLRRWTTGVFQPKIEQQMLADKQPVMRYFSMKERPEIINGVVMEPYSPRYSTGYGAVQNRVFLLVETHALKDYRTRVTGNYLLMQHLFELLNSEKTTLQNINRETDDITARQLSGITLPLDYVVNYRDTTWVDFLGIDYDVVPSDISG